MDTVRRYGVKTVAVPDTQVLSSKGKNKAAGISNGLTVVIMKENL